jgi:hypothetical protein
MISDLTPRKGRFSFSPWQRHGKTVPQKECALKGHPNMLDPFQFGRNHEAPLMSLLFYEPSVRRCHGPRVACPFGAGKIRLLR